jgi:hypothetical protein
MIPLLLWSDISHEPINPNLTAIFYGGTAKPSFQQLKNKLLMEETHEQHKLHGYLPAIAL